MMHQHMKLSASAQELGSTMLFEHRVGFSGTPSSLIPKDLGVCQFEPGSEAAIFQSLSSPVICDVEFLEQMDWQPKSILDLILRNGKYKALIDTGALITGFSNLEVARYLLEHGLQNNGIDGVVYLDEGDRKMVLVAATGNLVKLEECGVAVERRFAFYDQVHTTGMDIKHAPNARALLTLGKDMVFRDLAQGAYRMRRICRGQTITYLIIPEIRNLIMREIEKLKIMKTDQKDFGLINILIWLLMNSMRSERLQFNQLALQNVGNVYRKAAFQNLLEGSAAPCSSLRHSGFLESLEVFKERVFFDICDCVPNSVGIHERLQELHLKCQVVIENDEENLKEIRALHEKLGQNYSNQAHNMDQDLNQEMQQEQVAV
jgi:hypothetical protein